MGASTPGPAAQRRIWAALHELESQTRDAVYDRLGDTAGRFATAARIANASGTANGAAVAALPHRLQMRSLVMATKPFLPQFRKLDRYFADSSLAPFDRSINIADLQTNCNLAAHLAHRLLAGHSQRFGR